MNTTVPVWTRLVVIILLTVMSISATFVKVKGPRSGVASETAISMVEQTDKPYVWSDVEEIIKIPVLLFIISRLPALQVSGKVIRKRLTFTASERNCFYNHVSIHAP